MDKTSRNILLVFLFVLIFYLLKTLSVIMIPFVLAMLFAVLFHPLIIYLEKIKIPRAFILPLISIITLLIIMILFNIIINTTAQIVSQQDYLVSRLNTKLESFLHLVNNLTGAEFNVKSFIKEISQLINMGLVSKTAGGLARTLSSFTGSFVMFSIYYIVFLSGMSNYETYLNHVGGKKKGAKLVANYEVIRKSIFSYIIIKTFISMGTGILAGMICWFFGVKFALFFGFLTFLLNFIPSIGSIIATIPPILMLIIQTDSLKPVVAILVLLMSVQLIMGNAVEPRVLGNKLRLNTFTVIFGLVFWGYIWGIPGMILSVPLMVILKLILEQVNGTEIIARAMGYPEKNKEPIEE